MKRAFAFRDVEIPPLSAVRLDPTLTNLRKENEQQNEFNYPFDASAQNFGRSQHRRITNVQSKRCSLVSRCSRESPRN